MSKEKPEDGDVFIVDLFKDPAIFIIGLRGEYSICSDMSAGESKENIRMVTERGKYIGNIKKDWDKFMSNIIADYRASK